MPNYTQNLELIKPLPNENYNVENFNNNADIIDQAITEQAGALASHLAETATGAHKAKNISIDDAQGLFNATHVEGALEELFTSVSDGKNLIATAITDKGGTASGSDTFAQLANQINNVANWDPDLVPENIKSGVEIFGKIGTLAPSVIKSVQCGEASPGSSNIGTTISISPVNTSYSVVYTISASTSSWTNANQYCDMLASFENSSSIYCERSSTGSNTSFIWVVIEFYPEAVKSIQSGTFVNTAPVFNSINPLKSRLYYSAKSDYSGTARFALYLNTPKTIKVEKNTTPSHNVTVNWFVVEFY